MSIKSKFTKKSLRDTQKIAGAKLTLGRLIWAIRQSDETSQIEFAKKLGYPQEQFVRLCLQDMVDKAKLNIIVETRSNYFGLDAVNA